MMRQFLPAPLRTLLLRLIDSAKILTVRATPSPGNSSVKVSYGHWRMPGASQIVSGGMVKFSQLNQLFSHSFRSFNILYLGSSSLPGHWAPLLEVAKDKGAKVVWNQNGVGYPAWAGSRWKDVNRPMKRVLNVADHVFYQSEFCKSAADRFLGEPSNAWEILYNPVDTRMFHPPERLPNLKRLTLLHAGSIRELYRFEAVVRTVKELIKRGLDAILLFSGIMNWEGDQAACASQARQVIHDAGVADHVRLLAPYSRQEAPSVFARAHMLLHSKINDPCPTVVLEAMASGLPVVYSASGGVPELVGPDAGIGVPDHAGWDEMSPADPGELADAVLRVVENWRVHSQAARRRAVEKFDVQRWIDRHREVFEDLLRIAQQ